jgi:hypothetical protein
MTEVMTGPLLPAARELVGAAGGEDGMSLAESQGK